MNIYNLSGLLSNANYSDSKKNPNSSFKLGIWIFNIETYCYPGNSPPPSPSLGAAFLSLSPLGLLKR